MELGRHMQAVPLPSPPHFAQMACFGAQALSGMGLTFRVLSSFLTRQAQQPKASIMSIYGTHKSKAGRGPHHRPNTALSFFLPRALFSRAQGGRAQPEGRAEGVSQGRALTWAQPSLLRSVPRKLQNFPPHTSFKPNQ